MKSLLLKSPAKINLFLKVINKRKDGFHNIKTLFERIDLFDEISFIANNSGKIIIDCNDPQVPKGKRNLIYQVYAILKKDFNIKKGVNININKRIPVAAGLGGGSSNAATALIGFNRLFNLRLTRSKLLTYGRLLGSDIGFFLYNKSWALGTDKGDVIHPVNLQTKLWHILVAPCVKVYSSEVYSSLKLELTKTSDNVNILIHKLKNKDMDKVGLLLKNDLEDAIIRICPKLNKLKERLKLFDTQGVMISGSGPSVFGVTKSQIKAEKIAAKLSNRYTRVYVVRTR